MNLWQLARVGDTKKFKSVARTKSPQDLNETDRFGFTCLHWAAQKGEEEIVRLLIKRGADLDVVDGDLQTPLHWAIDKAHKSITKLLIENSAALDIQDKFGHSALHRAAALGQREIVELLLRSGANPNLQNQNGWTALHVTCYYAHHKIVRELLLSACTDVNVPNKDGWTPLHCAAMQGHDDLCDLLIRRNANIDFSSRDGSTPLHLAVQENHETAVQLLLNYGANPNLRNSRGRRPIDLTSSEHLKIILKNASKLSHTSCVLFGGVDKALVGSTSTFFILISAVIEATDFTVDLTRDEEGESEEETINSTSTSRGKNEDKEKEKEKETDQVQKLSISSWRFKIRPKKPVAATPIIGFIRGDVKRFDDDLVQIAIESAAVFKDKENPRSPRDRSTLSPRTQAQHSPESPRLDRTPAFPRWQIPKFQASYTLSEAGQYRLLVTCRGELVTQCPIVVRASEAITDPTKSEVIEIDDHITVNQPSKLIIKSRNQHGGDRTVGGDSYDVDIVRQEQDEGTSKRNILLHSDEARIRKEDLKDGSYIVWYTISTSGVHFIDIKLANVRIVGSPFKIISYADGKKNLVRSPRSSKKLKSSKDAATNGAVSPRGTSVPELTVPKNDSSKQVAAMRPIGLPDSGQMKNGLSTKNAGQFILPSGNEATDSSESDVWERMRELEKVNQQLQQKQLEFEREKYELHAQIAKLQHKLEKKQGQQGSGKETASDDQRKEVEELRQKAVRLAAQAREAQRELLQERLRRMCRICATQEREMVVLPCLHACFCALCVSRMQECALCSSPLQGFLRIKSDKDY